MTDELWPEPVPEPEPTEPSRRDRFHYVMRLEGLASAAKAAADKVRAGLDEEARTEFERTGAAPTWRMADIGIAALPVTKEAVVVSDVQALLGWCRSHKPEQIRTVEEIEPAFQAWLLQHCVVDGDKAVHPETGEVMPGLAVRAGGQPRSLSFRPEPGVKAAFGEHGTQWLLDILGGSR
jgi:hypothetical protein